jgi:hypothetical protein
VTWQAVTWQAADAEGWWMNDSTDEPEDAATFSSILPDVTQIPLAHLLRRQDTALDVAIRRQVADILSQDEVTAGFGNAPIP